MTAVKIAGLGAVSANGLSKDEVFASVVHGLTATNEDGICSLSESDWQTILEQTPASLRASRATLLGYRALNEALTEAKWSAEDLSTAGFIYATTTAQIDTWEKDLPTPPKSLRSQSLAAPAMILAKELGIRGPTSTIASSCSASLQALAMAYLWIQSGRVRRCIVGATELNARLTRTGFQSLRLLSKSTCKPFDVGRGGINLGEGSAFLLLEAFEGQELNLPQGAEWGYLTGAGLSSDAFHPTSPTPEGIGSQSSIRMALASARLHPQQIEWVYAHGTGSTANDTSEAAAIQKFFPHSPVTTSTKSMHGHTLAVSGAIESILGLMAMKHGKILGTANCLQPDPKLGIRINEKTIDQNFSVFLKNSLGFGGINASVIFQKHLTPQQKLETTEPQPSVSAKVMASEELSASSVDWNQLEPRFRRATKNMTLATLAVEKLLTKLPEGVDKKNVSFILGTHFGEVQSTLDFLNSTIPSPLLFQNSLHNSTLGFTTVALELTGPSMTISMDIETPASSRMMAETLLQVTPYAIICLVDSLETEAMPGFLAAYSEAAGFLGQARCLLLART